MSRPSEPLLQLFRSLAKKRGLNTAAMAQAANMERGRLKRVLSGGDPMTVDELIQLANGLEIDAQTLAGIGATVPMEDPTESVIKDPDKSLEATIDEATDPNDLLTECIDPYGNHSEQVLRVAFELGCDIYCHLETSKLEDSGIPTAVQSRFPEFLPLRLEAAYHRHNHPVFLPQGLQLHLSFDALYTCTLPWDAFQQITLFPLPWEPTGDAPAPEPDNQSSPVPHLRLVD